MKSSLHLFVQMSWLLLQISNMMFLTATSAFSLLSSFPRYSLSEMGINPLKAKSLGKFSNNDRICGSPFQLFLSNHQGKDEKLSLKDSLMIRKHFHCSLGNLLVALTHCRKRCSWDSLMSFLQLLHCLDSYAFFFQARIFSLLNQFDLTTVGFVGEIRHYSVFNFVSSKDKFSTLLVNFWIKESVGFDSIFANPYST